jgi:hypothetical protein
LDDFRTEPAKFGSFAQQVMKAVGGEYPAGSVLIAGVAIAIQDGEERVVVTFVDETRRDHMLGGEGLFRLAAKAQAN